MKTYTAFVQSPSRLATADGNRMTAVIFGWEPGHSDLSWEARFHAIAVADPEYAAHIPKDMTPESIARHDRYVLPIDEFEVIAIFEGFPIVACDWIEKLRADIAA